VVLDIPQREGLTRIAAKTAFSLGQWKSNELKHVALAYRQSESTYACRITASRIEPEMHSRTGSELLIEEHRMQLSSHVNLTVRKAGVFRARFLIPEGLRISAVTGQIIDSWSEDRADGVQGLIVSFKRKVLGEEDFVMVMDRSYTSLPEKISVSHPVLIGADSQTGTVTVRGDRSIDIEADLFPGLFPAVVAQSGGRNDGIRLAYDFRKPDWRLDLGLSLLQPQISAEVLNLLTVGDGFIGGSAMVTYSVESAGVREFILDLPDSWRNVEVLGTDVRRRSVKDGVCRVSLQDRIMGQYNLLITYDQAFDNSLKTIQAGGLQTRGTVVEKGFVIVTSGAHLQQPELTHIAGLRSIRASEIPARYHASIDNTILGAYAYGHQPYELSLRIMRRESEDMLQAIAEHMKLMTVISDSGRRETQATYLVKNRSKDYMRVDLPRGATLWSVFVDDKPARPERDADTIIIPLPRSLHPDRTFPVDIIYTEQGMSGGGLTGARLFLTGPRADIDVSYVQWEVYLPDWMTAANFGGNVLPEGREGRSVRSQVDLASASVQRLVISNLGAGLALLVAFVMLILMTSAIRAGHGKAIGGAALAILISLTFFSITVPSFVKSRNTSQQNACINNLRQIDSGKEQWAMASSKADGEPLKISAVNAYIKGNATPTCPAGGRYSYGVVGESPRCTCPGHTFGGDVWVEPSQTGDTTLAPGLVAARASIRQAGVLEVGLLPVRVDLPRQGRVWLFSKVLHSKQMPLEILGEE